VVRTWTQKTVVVLFRDYIYKRFAGYDEERIARVAGVSVEAITFDSLGTVPYAPQIAKDGVLSPERYRWRIPYQTLDPWTPIWDELIAAGFAAISADGWRLSKYGVMLCEDLHRSARRYLESLTLPSTELKRLSATLRVLHRKIPASAERAQCAIAGLPLPGEVRSDILRVDRFASELWNFRDDAHITAWQAAGFAGPTLDVLSHLWEGTNGFEQLVLELDGRQSQSSVYGEVTRLVESGDVEQRGNFLALTTRGKARRELIERETDARYFAGWPDGRELAIIGDDMSALIEALP
jgi:hypothetical protein